jgi:hypothetical protein
MGGLVGPTVCVDAVAKIKIADPAEDEGMLTF